MKESLTISIIIPCWNSETQLKENLPSVILAANNVDAEIIVVDDHSTRDNSISYLESLGNKIRLIKNPQNLGFAKTVNVGVVASSRDLVVLLNTDVSPSPNCFVNARPYFGDESCFAVTFNSGGGRAGGRFSGGLLHHFPIKDISDNPLPSLWASGGQAIFDRQKWAELRGMDPLYAPFYWEDVDLGYRAWKMGWSIILAPDCKCVHNHKQSVIAGNFEQIKIKETAMRNQFIFVWKNLTDWRLLLNHLLHLPLLLFRYPRPVFAAMAQLSAIIRARLVAPKWVKSDQQVLANWK